MIEVDITSVMLEKAHQLAKELGELNNSITKGEGNIVGFLGEEVALKVLLDRGNKCERSNTYDFDIIVNSKKIDVKTKLTSVIPKEYYSCSVASFNTKQKCDYYAFVRVYKDLSKAWWCGLYKKEDYYKDAVFMKKGQVDPDNNFIVKADCYNLPISRLKKQ
jgi:hypothetical protein